MKTDEVFELIRTNGIGQDIHCFLFTKSKEKDFDYKSTVNNYKYQKGFVKIYMDKYHLFQSEKNLTKSPYCELLIKKDSGKFTIEVKLFCKFIKSENQNIYVRIFNIKYFDDNGIEINERISADEKRME